MFGEKRKHSRMAIRRVARVQAEGLSRECTIINISSGGARIYIEDCQLPQQLYLLISGDRPLREPCRLAWRLGNEAGLAFEKELRIERLF
jgi:hypothetical protein